jgi:tetratricopeptide (TPR) repeat protein
MIRARCGLLESDDEATTREKVAAKVREVVEDEQERRWIEPALLALLGIESGVAPEQLVGAWRTFFERLAATAPVVLVFEDFHNADSGLIDFVDHILEWSRAYPIYVVTLARPELLERRTDWGAGKRNFTSIYLEPLPEAAMREMLAGLVPGLPEPAVKAIIARADGIPLYAVETIRMLLAEGKLALKDDVYVPVGDLTSLAVPETLTALIAARLDGLPAEDRALILDAAVLGQSFTPAALAAVSGQDEAAIEPRMQILVKRELLTVGSDPRSPERGQYAFVQALIREVAYGMLAKRDRKTRHLAAARFFESLGSDELAGALAGHYLAAHQNAPEGPEADALAGQARIALKSAADRAISLGAHAQAVSFFEQALNVTPDEADRADLRLSAARSAESGAQFDVAAGYFADVEAWARANDAWSMLADALVGRARMLVNGTFNEPAISLLTAAIDEVHEHVGDRELGALNAELARAYSLHAEPQRGLEAADAALEYAGRAKDAIVIANALISKSTCLAGENRTYETVALLRGALDLAERRGFVGTGLRARNNLAGFVMSDDPAEAREVLEDGISLARRFGEGGWELALSRFVVILSFALGDWDGALATVDVLELRDPPDDMLAGYKLMRAEMLAARGDQDGARAALAESAHLVSGTSNPTTASYVRQVAPGWVALCEGRFADAYADAVAAASASWETIEDSGALAARAAALLHDGDGISRATELISSGMGPSLRTEAILTELDACRLAIEGQPAQAGLLFSSSGAINRRLGLSVEVALAAIVRSALLQPPDAATLAAVDEAREILARLRAAALLKLLDDAVAGSLSGSGSEGSASAPSATTAQPEFQSNVPSSNR